jgi:hypothetical protein
MTSADCDGSVRPAILIAKLVAATASPVAATTVTTNEIIARCDENCVYTAVPN